MKFILICLLLFTTCLIAEEIVQNVTDEYLQEIDAINEENLEIIESKVFSNGELFTGALFSKNEDGQLEVLEHYKNGMLNGSSARWYRSGQKQMEANFKNGRLNGYFKGWFENGDLKYDLNFADTAREEDSIVEDEKEGDADSGQKDQ